MSQQVAVDRNIVFKGNANNTNNVEGNFNPDRKFVFYDFTELALDETNKYTKVADTGCSVALGSGGLILTTDTTDADVATYAMGGIWWYPAKNPKVEMRFQLDVVTTVAINCGFTDAASEASQTLPYSISGTTLTDATSNGAMFVFDTAQTTDYWYCVNNRAGTAAATILGSAYAPVAATDVTLGISIDTLGNAKYFYNGVQVHYKALATGATTPLVPYFGIKNMTGTAHVATLKYCRLWQDM